MKKFTYTRIKNSILIILLTVLISPATIAETKVSVVLNKILETHRQYSAGLSVPYQREILTKSVAMLDDMGSDVASGTFFFREPDMLRVEQKEPVIEYVISNGKNIWFYEPEKKIVSKINEIGRSLSIISMIFTGLKNPEDTFSITLLEPDKTDDYELTLIPNETWDEIDNIKIIVSKKDYSISRIEIIDITGNLTRFKLGAFEKKTDLEEGFFNFTVPGDVRVIEEE